MGSGCCGACWLLVYPDMSPIQSRRWLQPEGQAAVEEQAQVTDDLIDATTHALTIAANEAGLFVSGDGRVSEADAAGLLGYSPNYLRQMRGEGKGPNSLLNWN